MMAAEQGRRQLRKADGRAAGRLSTHQCCRRSGGRRTRRHKPGWVRAGPTGTDGYSTTHRKGAPWVVATMPGARCVWLFVTTHNDSAPAAHLLQRPVGCDEAAFAPIRALAAGPCCISKFFLLNNLHRPSPSLSSRPVLAMAFKLFSLAALAALLLLATGASAQVATGQNGVCCAYILNSSNQPVLVCNNPANVSRPGLGAARRELHAAMERAETCVFRVPP